MGLKKHLFFGWGFLVLSNLLYAHETPPSFEIIPESEPDAIRQVQELIQKTVIQSSVANGGMATRDAHAKAHGCVHATVQVKSLLQEQFRTPLFVQNKKYKAWIRLSNGSGSVKSDSDKNGRGFAMKLTGVEGEKLSPTEKSTQDFLFINHPVFFVKDAADYIGFQETVHAGGNPVLYFLKHFQFKEVKILFNIAQRKVKNPLAIQYWSMTPYLNGKIAEVFCKT